MLEADHVPPSISKDKNSWRCIATPPHVFMAWFLIKDLTTSPLILPLFVCSKSEQAVPYFGAHKVMFNQMYEVRTTYT